MKKRSTVTKQDNFQAKLAFIFGMGFWIPLFNIGLSVAGLILGIKALNRIQKDSRFGGFNYAVAAIVLSSATLIGSIIFLSVYMYRKLTCDTLPSLI